jgi:hypothetical protein
MFVRISIPFVDFLFHILISTLNTNGKRNLAKIVEWAADTSAPNCSFLLSCLEAAIGKELWRDNYAVPVVNGPDSGHSLENFGVGEYLEAFTAFALNTGTDKNDKGELPQSRG